MMTVYWAFDEQLLEAALRDWIVTAAPDNHPEARAAAEHAAETVRTFLKGRTARRHKLRHELDVTFDDSAKIRLDGAETR